MTDDNILVAIKELLDTSKYSLVQKRRRRADEAIRSVRFFTSRGFRLSDAVSRAILDLNDEGQHRTATMLSRAIQRADLGHFDD